MNKLPKHYSPLLRAISFLLIVFFCTSTFAQWKYIKQVDKFTGDNDSHVRLKSKNSQPVGVNAQPITAELIVFESVDALSFKAAIMFSQNSLPVAASYNGSFCAGSYSCQALLKIDDGELIQLKIFDSGKGDKAFVYMSVRNDELIMQMLVAKKIEMRVAFYKRGDGNFVFTANGKNPLLK
jgi:hypothetical protein